ncbi:YitT family protein [Psychrobacillus antarcticus]|uniref:YitT family protein n=1 Tax=Psychrobacillus antarcticus TaxID=2879115 RepID=UPI002408611A|nr:YitT family protein [Psychrobacillus antarcticus]
MEVKNGQTISKFERMSRVLFIIMGALITAIGLEAVLIPNNIIDGGITGISILFSHLTGFSLSLFLFILNIPFVFIGYRELGKSFAFSSIIGITALSIATSLMHHIPTIISGDTMLVAVLGGIMIGLGVGIVLRKGGALDGTEILAILIAKKFPLSVGEVILSINVLIFSFAMLVYGLRGALCSAIAYFIAMKVIDLVQAGFDESKNIMIISNNSRKIGDAIQTRLGRGVTYVVGERGLSNERVEVVFCVINRLEEPELRTLIKAIDLNAFVAINGVVEMRQY